jgi:NAD-dependent dihydropyrimidine dehydrogenase PreA subunit
MFLQVEQEEKDMKRQIIKIDESKCNGCGLCAQACHEGAIAMVDGKARLVREDFCDGLGNCLPVCPTGAISFEEREASAFNADAASAHEHAATHGGCPGSKPSFAAGRQWPIQIKLVPPNAPYFDGADLVIAADCCAFADPGFHERFAIRGSPVRGSSGEGAPGRPGVKNALIIGCPKLDNVDYSEKLAAIIGGNDIRSVTVVRMEVPCCGALVAMAEKALKASGKKLPLEVAVINI